MPVVAYDLEEFEPELDDDDPYVIPSPDSSSSSGDEFDDLSC